MSIISSKQLTTTPQIWTGVLTFDTASFGCTAREVYNTTNSPGNPSLTKNSLGTYVLEFPGGAENPLTTDTAACTVFITEEVVVGHTLKYSTVVESQNRIQIQCYNLNDNLTDGLGSTAFLKIEVYPPIA